MKAGRSLRALLEEVKRQEAAKEDIAIDTRELEMRMSYQGALMRMPGRVAPVRDIAHGQIAEHAGIPSAYYARMRHDAPHLLTSNVNHWFRASPERRMGRLLDGNLRAFLSERYARIDNSNIAEAVLPVLFEVPDVQIVSAEITESRMYLKVVAPRTQQEVTVGDPVQAGVVVSNSEVGKGAVSIAPLVFRLVCDNGMIVADRHYRRHHIGARAAQDDALYQILSDEAKAADAAAIGLKVRDVLRAALDPARFAETLGLLKKAKQDHLHGNPIKAMEVLAKKASLSKSEHEDVLTHLIASQDLTRYGVVQAVTRAAQTPGDYDRATELEKLGGKVLTLSSKEWREIKTAA